MGDLAIGPPTGTGANTPFQHVNKDQVPLQGKHAGQVVLQVEEKNAIVPVVTLHSVAGQIRQVHAAVVHAAHLHRAHVSLRELILGGMHASSGVLQATVVLIPVRPVAPMQLRGLVPLIVPVLPIGANSRVSGDVHPGSDPA